MRLLDQLSLPGDLVSLSRDKMDQIAGEIREEIIQTVSETGGHLGPSLGVVELTLALHAELVTPRDKIIWDVGTRATHTRLSLDVCRSSELSVRTGGSPVFPIALRVSMMLVGLDTAALQSVLGLGLPKPSGWQARTEKALWCQLSAMVP